LEKSALFFPTIGKSRVQIALNDAGSVDDGIRREGLASLNHPDPRMAAAVNVKQL